jgi:DNA gyrase/topoisomerase IV subunit B
MPITVPNHNRKTDRHQFGMLIAIPRNPQLAETTMNPEKRTLLQVRLEDAVESEEIFSTLMGEDVESRRKFIEDNALDVKNLDV